MRELPIKRDLGLAYTTSLLVAALIVVVSAAGLILGPAGLYGLEAKAALGVVASTAGILVPGFLAHDVLNLVLGLPALAACLLLAHRGSLAGLLLWPGALYYYVLYSYTQSVVGAPFGVLFLPYVALVVISAYTVAALVGSVDAEQVRERLAPAVPARIVGGILVGLALLTLAQDGGGALATVLSGGIPIDPMARHIWIADLTLEVPAMLTGGVLLWRREALGYVVAPALLFQFGLTPIVLTAILVLQPFLTASPIDVGTIVGLLAFVVISYVPLMLIVRRAASSRRAESGVVRPRAIASAGKT